MPHSSYCTDINEFSVYNLCSAWCWHTAKRLRNWEICIVLSLWIGNMWTNMQFSATPISLYFVPCLNLLRELYADSFIQYIQWIWSFCFRLIQYEDFQRWIDYALIFSKLARPTQYTSIIIQGIFKCWKLLLNSFWTLTLSSYISIQGTLTFMNCTTTNWPLSLH